MEFPRGAVTFERALAAALVAACLAAAWVETGSTLAARTRDKRPWLAWLEARERGSVSAPSLHLLIYDTAARRLTLLHIPGTLRLDNKLTLERAYHQALKATGEPEAAAAAAEDLAEVRLRELSPEPLPAIDARWAIEIPAGEEEDEPSVAAAFELKSRSRRLRTWLSLARNSRRALDPLLFALEMRRVPVENIQPARLPQEDGAPALLGRLLAAEPLPDDGRGTIVEVLNGTDGAGLASRAAKMLRLKGVDVLSTASVPGRARTLVYDRVGDFRRAASVRAVLDCATSRAVTRVDPSRAVDVSIMLGADCADAFGTGESRER